VGKMEEVIDKSDERKYIYCRKIAANNHPCGQYTMQNNRNIKLETVASVP
jgi:hypothetical protein